MTFNFKNIAKPEHDLTNANDYDEDKNTKQKLLRTMNAVKIISPIMQALLINPGIDKSENALTNNFIEFVKMTSSLSSKTCLKLDVDPNNENNFWIRNVFERLFSEMLKEQWVNNSKIDENEIDLLLDEVINCSSNFVKSDFNKTDVDVDTEIQLSLVKSMIVVLSTIKSNFSLKRKVTDDFEHIMSTILENSKKQLVSLSDDSFDESKKANLLKLLILEAGQLYSASWISYAKFAEGYFNNLSDNDKQKFNKKYENGLPISKVDEEFSDYFDKMITVSKKLIPQTKGSIEKRIKNK